MIRKIVFAILAVCLLSPILFLVVCQRMVNDGFEISDNYCINVNPLIITRKNRNNDVVNLLMSSASGEVFLKAEDNYFSSSKAYVLASEEWLKKQKAFLERWDFQLLAYPELKQAVILQYQIYKQDSDTSGALNNAYDHPNDANLQSKIFQDTVEQDKKRGELIKKYADIKMVKHSALDLRYLRLSTPTSKCPSENLIFPQVPDMFSPKPVESPSSPATDFINIFSLG